MEEGQLELAESVVRRDEGDLPDHGRAVVCSQHLSKPSFTFGRRRLHQASVLEPQRHAGYVGSTSGTTTASAHTARSHLLTPNRQRSSHPPAAMSAAAIASAASSTSTTELQPE